MSVHDKIDLAAAQHGLAGTRFAAGVTHFGTIGSTNTELMRAAGEGAPEGTVYVADEQTAGRGRGGHQWHSEPGYGLYVSALVRPKLKPDDGLLLSLAAGIAVQQAIEQTCGLTLDIRWPNDLMLTVEHDGGTRKCGGILVESAIQPGEQPTMRHAVIGIGLNVHHSAFPAELKMLATSLRLNTCEPLHRTSLLIALLRALDREVTMLEREPASHRGLLHRFTMASSWVLGKRVSVPEDGGYTGTTSGLDARGYLQVAGDDGVDRTVRSGGVRAL